MRAARPMPSSPARVAGAGGRRREGPQPCWGPPTLGGAWHVLLQGAQAGCARACLQRSARFALGGRQGEAAQRVEAWRARPPPPPPPSPPTPPPPPHPTHPPTPPHTTTTTHTATHNPTHSRTLHSPWSPCGRSTLCSGAGTRSSLCAASHSLLQGQGERRWVVAEGARKRQHTRSGASTQLPASPAAIALTQAVLARLAGRQEVYFAVLAQPAEWAPVEHEGR